MATQISPHDCTVGWVCALPIELAAAVEMVDEEFADLPSQPTDNNVYSFGRIGAHSVVAASTLRFGVLVGIGGGVPDLDDDVDIWLGDVYDFGKTGMDGCITCTGSLSAPPTILLNALAKLHASSLHISGATCANCLPEGIVDREVRATSNPVLFFGNIASGNQVMKDGWNRDKHSQDLGGIWCFEMEAAGLKHPCLRSRGGTKRQSNFYERPWS
ncbi:hypothetical protein LX36DRAFT_687751 [Colletotrichum falcatum]|nr:hypothetical protein LX36DRAFT_687751 [Colletotrichum falcatum]